VSNQLTLLNASADASPNRAALDGIACVPLARMFKALGDPVRLRLLSLIASHSGGEACVCDISGTFELSQPTISHHLKVLRSAGILDSERRGSWVYYRVIPAALQQLSTILQIEGGTATSSDACTEETAR
jgi:ArsR family transcriptional regulator